MNLSPEFHFSQNNLQDYVDCPRRFELRYLLRQEWPALQSEPVLEQERRMEEGRLFHKMIQQLIIGLPVDVVGESALSLDLSHWWDNFRSADPLNELPQQKQVEYSLSGALAGYRLTAQYDLLAVDPGKKAVIIDWKTSLKKPARNYLKNRLQTRVYRFLLVEAGQSLNGNQPILPDQVEMVYWFAEYPDEPERFPYDQKQYSADRTYLSGLITEIAGHAPGKFVLTPDEKKCLFCNYRSLCDRGEKAGDWDEVEDEPLPSVGASLDIGFDQIGEVEF
jgi:hypothetical protein